MAFARRLRIRAHMIRQPDPRNCWLATENCSPSVWRPTAKWSLCGRRCLPESTHGLGHITVVQTARCNPRRQTFSGSRSPEFRTRAARMDWGYKTADGRSEPPRSSKRSKNQSDQRCRTEMVARRSHSSVIVLAELSLSEPSRAKFYSLRAGQARCTRRAISPRLAIKIFSNMIKS